MPVGEWDRAASDPARGPAAAVRPWRASGAAAWARRGLAAAALAAALALLATAASDWPRALDLLDYPFTLDYGEGVVVSQVRDWLAGQELYPAGDRLGAPGFVGANYPPLYYLAAGLMPNDPDSIYSGARVLSFLGYLASALLAGLLVGGATRRPAAGLLTAAAALALPPAREWGLFAKPDLLALALSLAGLAVAVLAPRRVLWAAPPFALALLTKQTMVAAPAAVALALLLTPGRRREALALGGLTGGLALAPLLLLEIGPGEVFWHLVLVNARGWEWGRFAAIALTFLEVYWPLAVVAALGLALVAPLRGRWVPGPAVFYVPLALLTLLAAGAPGSSRNYALEPGLGLAIGAGLGVAWLAERRGRWQPALVAGVALLLAVQSVGLWTLPERAFGRQLPGDERRDRRNEVLAFVRGATGPLLSEDVGLLVQAGLPVEYHDPSLMRKLTVAGSWDERHLLEQIKARHFAFILTESDLGSNPNFIDRWSPAAVAAIRANYRLLHRDRLMIYAPRASP